MSSYILCQVKRASMPYYIENISTNIYSIEELCYYFYHNIYLLDETILNEHLCDWLRKELGLEKLYKRLYKVLEDGLGTSEFILAVFKEINYLTHKEFKELNEKLNLLELQPVVLREKKKGDYLVENKMYVNAIRIYENALQKEDKEKQATARQSRSLLAVFHIPFAPYVQTLEEVVPFLHLPLLFYNRETKRLLPLLHHLPYLY